MSPHYPGSTPTSIKKKGKRLLVITWDDGHVSEYTFRYLRQFCPCAECVDEVTGEKRLDPESIPLDLEGLRVAPVGNYALSFSFSDTHATGIYHFELLRRVCPCEFCAKTREGEWQRN